MYVSQQKIVSKLQCMEGDKEGIELRPQGDLGEASKSHSGFRQ